MAGPAVKGQKDASGFPQAPFGAVAHHRPADPPGGGKADADKRRLVFPVARLHDHRSARGMCGGGGQQEIRPLF